MISVLTEILVTLTASPAISLVAKGTVVVALGLISAWFARRSRAAVRHALLASAFSVLLALPIVSFLATPVPIAVPVAKGDSDIWLLFNNISAPSSGQPEAEGFRAATAKSGWALPPLSTMLLYGWLLGTAFFMIPIVRGLLQIRSLRRYGLPWRHEQAAAGRKVEVLLHESLPGPMTSGVLHPVIILPAEAQTWNQQDLKRALVHELEHVRRYDWPIHCLARLACAAYWFHPLVWIAWRQLTLEAERSCDDAVLRNSEPTAYADQLVGLARRRSVVGKSPLLAMAGRSDLAARIGALLDPRQARGRAGTLLVVAACAMAAVIVLTMSPLQMVAAPQGRAPTAVREEAAVFEVASIKPSDPANARVAGAIRFLPGGRLRATNLPLPVLVAIAWDIPFQGPRFVYPPSILTDRYDVQAKAADNAVSGLSSQARDAKVRSMLRALLIDRFRLNLVSETKVMHVYDLMVAKGGPRLEKAKIEEKDCSLVTAPSGGIPSDPAVDGGVICHRLTSDRLIGMRGVAVTMSDLARYMDNGIAVDRPVIDRTGLKGLFSINTTAYQGANTLPGTPDADLPTFSELLARMGLELKPDTAPVGIYRIEHIEKPTAN